MQHSILVHEPKDDVGVAVVDLAAGTEAGAVTLEGVDVGQVKVTEAVPLGHKVALRAVAKGAPVIEYGRPIGQSTKAIARGAHVHVQNLKTRRWAR